MEPTRTKQYIIVNTIVLVCKIVEFWEWRVISYGFSLTVWLLWCVVENNARSMSHQYHILLLVLQNHPTLWLGEGIKMVSLTIQRNQKQGVHILILLLWSNIQSSFLISIHPFIRTWKSISYPFYPDHSMPSHKHLCRHLLFQKDLSRFPLVQLQLLVEAGL